MGSFRRASSGLLWLAVIALCSEAAFGRILETLNCTQSSVAFNGHCGRALDGNKARNFARNSCTHTRQQTRPWWQATLKSVSRVKAVRIFNRGDCCAERLNNFVVQVDGRTCAVHKSSTPFDVKKLACNRDGRVVRIVNTAGTILTLCEVQILGWPVRPAGSCSKAAAQQLSKKLQLAKQQLKRGIRNARNLYTKTVKSIGESKSKEMPLRRTCEHAVGVFACPKGYTVSIQQALYGRQSTTYCPRGRLSARTNCAAKNALSIAKSRCRGRQSCLVPAANSIFGDPCPGTFKYLEIAYKCVRPTGEVRGQLKAARRRYQTSKGKLRTRFRAAKTSLKARIITEERRYERCLGGVSCESEKTKELNKAIAKEKQRHKNALKNVQRARKAELAAIEKKRLIPKPEAQTCENHAQTISCPAGYAVKLLSVFYGRKNAASCPHPQIHTVKCQARNAAVKVKSLCEGKQTCKLQSSNAVFGDPCPGTYKYMLVKHACQMTDAKFQKDKATAEARYRNTVTRLGKTHLATIKSLSSKLKSQVARHETCVKKRRQARHFTKELQQNTKILRQRLLKLTYALKKEKIKQQEIQSQCSQENKLQHEIVKRSIQLFLKRSKMGYVERGRRFQELKRLLKQEQILERLQKSQNDTRGRRRRVSKRGRRGNKRRRPARRGRGRKRRGTKRRRRGNKRRRPVRRGRGGRRRGTKRGRRGNKRRRPARRGRGRRRRGSKRGRRGNKRQRPARRGRGRRRGPKRGRRGIKRRRPVRRGRGRRRRGTKRGRRGNKRRRPARRGRGRRRRGTKRGRRGNKRRRPARRGRGRKRRGTKRGRRGNKRRRLARRGRGRRRRRVTSEASKSFKPKVSAGFASSNELLKFFGDSLGVSQDEDCYTIISDREVSLWLNVQNLLQKSLESVRTRDFSAAEKREFISSVTAKLNVAKQKYNAALQGVRVCVPKQSQRNVCLQDVVKSALPGFSERAAQSGSNDQRPRKQPGGRIKRRFIGRKNVLSSRTGRIATRVTKRVSRRFHRVSRRINRASRKEARRARRAARRARRASRRAARRARRASRKTRNKKRTARVTRRASRKAQRRARRTVRQTRRASRKAQRRARRAIRLTRRASRKARRSARKAVRLAKKAYRKTQRRARKAVRLAKKAYRKTQRRARKAVKLTRRAYRKAKRRARAVVRLTRRASRKARRRARRALRLTNRACREARSLARRTRNSESRVRHYVPRLPNKQISPRITRNRRQMMAKRMILQ